MVRCVVDSCNDLRTVNKLTQLSAHTPDQVQPQNVPECYPVMQCCFQFPTASKLKFPADRGTPRVKYMWQPSLLAGDFTSRIPCMERDRERFKNVIIVKSREISF